MLNKKAVAAFATALVTSLVLTTSAFAEIVTTSGAMEQIAAPSSVRIGGTQSNSSIFVFPESEEVVLPRDVRAGITEPGSYGRLRSLTRGVIPEGTVVNSYLIHADAVGRPAPAPAR